MLRSHASLLSLAVALVAIPRVARAQNAPPFPAKTLPPASVSANEQNGISGSTGLLHLRGAGPGKVGTFRLSLLADGYSGSGFLCNGSTPCSNSSQDSVSHFGTTLGLSATPLPWLEAYASLHSFANSDDQRSPGLLEVLNNTSLGGKAYLPNPFFGVLALGGSAELDLLSGSGAVGFSGKSTSARLTAIADADLEHLSGTPVPLRLIGNLGYFLDNSGALVESVEQSRGAPITRVERFGLSINRVDRVELGLGVEGRFEVAQPFIEWNLAVPVNRQGYNCVRNRVSLGDRCLANDDSASAFPSALTLGTRVTPLIKNLTATAALDIGLSGTSSFLEELAPTLPWDLWLGLGYRWDVQEPPPQKIVIREQVPAALPPAAPELRIRGLVHENGKTEGLADAILHFTGRELTPMASDAAGHFVSAPLEPGSYVFSVTLEGYKPGTCQVTLPPASPGKPSKEPEFSDLDCALEAVPHAGSIDGRVLDADSGAPVPSATVEVTDSLHRTLKLTTDSNGAFRFEQVLPGLLTFKAESDDYLFHTQTLTLHVREDAHPELGLHKRPKVSLVSVSATELKIKQQIHFEQDSPAIVGDSNALLEQIADTLARTPTIAHLEIQGHTDNTGTAEHNKALSEARANAVLEWLVAHGIDASRLSAHGFGQERPISPNVTPQGRARNRRVQFVIQP